MFKLRLRENWTRQVFHAHTYDLKSICSKEKYNLYLQEWRHSIIVVASTRYPAHNAHIMWGFNSSSDIRRSDILARATLSCALQRGNRPLPWLLSLTHTPLCLKRKAENGSKLSARTVFKRRGNYANGGLVDWHNAIRWTRNFTYKTRFLDSNSTLLSVAD